MYPLDFWKSLQSVGLPEDVKARKLQNLLQWFPGYEAYQFNYRDEHPMGFPLFPTPDFAHATKDALQMSWLS